jgi:hypothetical protein
MRQQPTVTGWRQSKCATKPAQKEFSHHELKAISTSSLPIHSLSHKKAKRRDPNQGKSFFFIPQGYVQYIDFDIKYNAFVQAKTISYEQFENYRLDYQVIKNI